MRTRTRMGVTLLWFPRRSGWRGQRGQVSREMCVPCSWCPAPLTHHPDLSSQATGPSPCPWCLAHWPLILPLALLSISHVSKATSGLELCQHQTQNIHK